MSGAEPPATPHEREKSCRLCAIDHFDLPSEVRRRNVGSTATRWSLCGPKSRRWSGRRAGAGPRWAVDGAKCIEKRLRPEEMAEQKLEKKLKQALVRLRGTYNCENIRKPKACIVVIIGF